jgi:hypothetical protein
MSVRFLWQENADTKGKDEKMLQASAEVVSTSLNIFFFQKSELSKTLN